jgi:hypothetical protein
MRRKLVVLAVTALAAATPAAALAADDRAATAPNGERGLALALAHGAGTEGAGKISVQDLSFVFSSGSGEPPGQELDPGAGN